MKNFLIILVALLGMSSARAEAPKTDLFEYTCTYLDFFYGVECGDLEEPTIVTSKVVSSLFYGFYYKGEKYIFISPRISDYKWRETVVHEMTHYILDWTKYGNTRCEGEEIARRAHHSYTNTKYDDSWRNRYGCNKR